MRVIIETKYSHFFKNYVKTLVCVSIGLTISVLFLGVPLDLAHSLFGGALISYPIAFMLLREKE